MNLDLFVDVAAPLQQEAELRGGGGDVLTAVCDHLGLQQHNTEVKTRPPPAAGPTDGHKEV